MSKNKNNSTKEINNEASEKLSENAVKEPEKAFAPASQNENVEKEISSSDSGSDEHSVYLRVAQAYEEAKEKRNKYKKYGPLVVIISGIVLLSLMFTLENKIAFLCLWVFTDFYCVALMIRAEYKYYQFGKILGLSGDGKKTSEAEEKDLQ